jgi:hypothetical protein
MRMRNLSSRGMKIKHSSAAIPSSLLLQRSSSVRAYAALHITHQCASGAHFTTSVSANWKCYFSRTREERGHNNITAGGVRDW